LYLGLSSNLGLASKILARVVLFAFAIAERVSPLLTIYFAAASTAFLVVSTLGSILGSTLGSILGSGVT